MEPTRRFRRPLSARSSYRLPESSDIRFDGPSEDGLPTSSVYVQHRQTVQPDALRGAMLVALVVVTIVLYALLWELERSSFASVPNPNAISLSSVALHTVIQNSQVFPSGEISNLPDDPLVLPSSKPGYITPNTWPPSITRLPEEQETGVPVKKDDDLIDKNDSSDPSSFDATYCSGACRLLLPARIGEQESKARIHFTQLFILAQKLNRTIVLPNVGRSRISACSKWHFDAYYDTNGFVPNNDTSDSRLVMQLDDFAKWIDKRPTAPSAFIISMESIPRNRGDVDVLGSHPEDTPFIVDKTEADPKLLSCLESRLPTLRSSLPEVTLTISFNSHSHSVESNTSTRLVHLLSNRPNTDTDTDFDLMTGPGYDHTSRYGNYSHPPLADTDVLVLDYDLRHPLFAVSVQPRFSLHYAPVLYDLADRLSDNLGPFLGVHWRMENVPVQNLAWCAASLVSTVHALLHDDISGKHIRHVWLATDHPRSLGTFVDGFRFPLDAKPTFNGPNGKPWHDYAPSEKSSTFKVLTSEHDNAIGMLAEAFQPGGDLEAWKLTDLAEQLRHYPYIEGRFDLNETLLSDAGVFGVLDKLVVVQAKMFVSGSTDCSKTSSFSKQVIEARQGLLQRGKGAIRNVVEYFGKW